MEHKVVIEKLTDCVKDIFAFSASRLYNKQDAEDLTNDIIVEVLSSAGRLENDSAFYGYMWRIAENTLKRYIRSKKLGDGEDPTEFVGVYWDTPESKLLEEAELAILRRELSLLSKQYREVTVKYYIESKSCTAIAKELAISEEMVKYYLFKTRKLLKEGVTMDRKYGEKSYNPGKFYINFWGNGNNGYIWRTFERRLPGNIVLAAYKKPLSLEELSLELGVSAPYLEDELEILLKHNFVRKTGSKYQTDFLIFTTDFETEFRKTVPAAEICTQTVAQIAKGTEAMLPQFRKMDLGIQMDDNRLRWFVVNLTLHSALGQFEGEQKKRFGPYPRMNANAWGYVYGHDNDYLFNYFQGIYGQCGNREGTAWYSAVNYNAIKTCQLWRGCGQTATEILCDGIRNAPLSDQDRDTVAELVQAGALRIEDGRLKADFPTFTGRQHRQMQQALQEMILTAVDCMDKICKMSTGILKKYAPKHLQDRCERMSYVYHQADAMGIIVEKLVADGFLQVPEERTNLCFFGVKRLSEETN